MKIHPKSVLLGSLIALLLFTGVSYAANLMIFRFVVEVPPAVKLSSISTHVSDETYQISIDSFDENKAISCTKIKNCGTDSLTIEWNMYNKPPELLLTVFTYDLYLSGKIHTGDDYEVWEEGESITLSAGEEEDLEFWIQNTSNKVKTYVFTMIISES
ncbi:unnamed protein product [marine sediment metagenome]|uniref:Uncharacterized protein n=1 Tax=marine sediment metagenome TaxID=412755 RepID=X1C8R8_9ZZZZ